MRFNFNDTKVCVYVYLESILLSTSDLVDFCEDVYKWLEGDVENVIVVHCKGGKGRTGTMVAAWLVRAGLFHQARESLDYFKERRTDKTLGKKNQGVNTPSQVCKYMYTYISFWKFSPSKNVHLKNFYII